MKVNKPEFIFEDLRIDLKKHDTSSTGLPAYIEVELGKTPKDKGLLVLDLGNYIYRKTGIAYEHCPEYKGRGKKTTVRWFVSWKGITPLLENIYKAVCPERKVIANSLPFEFNSLIIQDKSKGVI